jgi:uncharacterized protein
MKGSDRLHIGPARVGQGLFASKPFKAKQRIIRLYGRIVSADMVWHNQGKFADNTYRFGPETYLDPGEEAGAFVNHACEPNAAVGKSGHQLFLFAVKDIRRNEELTFDYSTILGDDDLWTMKCACGANTCRKRIKRFGSLPVPLRKEYVARGMVPKFILDTIE